MSGRLVGKTQTVTLFVQERFLELRPGDGLRLRRSLLVVIAIVVLVAINRCCAPKEIA